MPLLIKHPPVWAPPSLCSRCIVECDVCYSEQVRPHYRAPSVLIQPPFPSTTTVPGNMLYFTSRILGATSFSRETIHNLFAHVMFTLGTCKNLNNFRSATVVRCLQQS